MEAFLNELLPRMLPTSCDFKVYPFQGKNDLLRKLPGRLSGYAQWLPEDWRIIVVVDRDDDDCTDLKRRLEQIAKSSGLRTRSRSRAGTQPWHIANRIAVEELEAWYFGDWDAVRHAYPHVSATIPRKSGFRDPDAVSGGTWETFERVLNKAGYFRGGLRKIEVARRIGSLIDPSRNYSHSFQTFCEVIAEVTA